MLSRNRGFQVVSYLWSKKYFAFTTFVVLSIWHHPTKKELFLLLGQNERISDKYTECCEGVPPNMKLQICMFKVLKLQFSIWVKSIWTPNSPFCNLLDLLGIFIVLTISNFESNMVPIEFNVTLKHIKQFLSNKHRHICKNHWVTDYDLPHMCLRRWYA